MSRRQSSRIEKSFGAGSMPGRTCSKTNGAASMRNPEAPSWSQNPITLLISARTSGLDQFRSGWNS